MLGNINFITSTFISRLKIPTILDNPLKYLINKWEQQGNTITTALNDSKFVGLQLFGETLIAELNIISDTFDFKKILEKVFLNNDNEFVKFIINNINNFTCELNRDSNINLATFIGQLGRNINHKGEINEHEKSIVKTHLLFNSLSILNLLVSEKVTNRSNVYIYMTKVKKICDEINYIKFWDRKCR